MAFGAVSRFVSTASNFARITWLERGTTPGEIAAAVDESRRGCSFRRPISKLL